MTTNNFNASTLADDSPSPTPELRFPIIGIVGASGSRQALEMLFRNLPADSGMAFVIVVRMGSNSIKELPALLQKRSEMAIVAAADGVRPEIDHVYIAPAGVQVTIERNELQLRPLMEREERSDATGQLDTFLHSLADTRGAEATAILLSGTGSDGVAGLKRIQDGGGMVLVQDPDEAAHGALPRRAVATCPAAVVATAGEIARQLVQAKGDLADATVVSGPAATFEEIYAVILNQIAAQTGHDLSHFKVSTLHRRIARRMAMAGIPNFTQYVELLKSTPAETVALFQDTLVSVTSFFRDSDAYEMLERDCIPQLFAEKGRSDYVRVWTAGCATGQEAYSVAMQLVEYAAQVEEPPRLQVFATDLDEEAIAVARHGVYPATIAQEMTSARLERFFSHTENGYRVKPEIREHVLFAVHDLLRDPPFSRLDLVICRNVLIYFSREAQEKLFATFHYALNSQGYLFLGTSESADAAPNLFAVLDKYCHLYQRRDVVVAPQRRPPTPVSTAFGGRPADQVRTAKATSPRTLEELYTSWSLRVHTPPRLLVNSNYEITHLFGDVAHYLRDPEGPVTQSILQRILPELRLDLRTALYQAFNKAERSVSRTLRVEKDGAAHIVHLHVGPITEPGFPPDYVEVVFVAKEGTDVLGFATAGEAIETNLALVMRMEEELMRTRERLQMIVEEYENSSQELKASNEELQSINEELKSTTEELETSKEELQSMNEELVTVNGELTDKIEELNRANSDLLNLIASTDVGTIFLDSRLRINRFTPRATDLFNLIETDIGRPFTHVTHHIRHSHLPQLAAHVRDTVERIEETVQSDADKWYILRLFPYRTVTGTVDGVVITFFDISDLKRAESEERQRRQQQVLAALSRQGLADADLDLLFSETTQRVADVLDMKLCKILQLQPDSEALLLRAGVGWQPGLVGHATVPTDPHSQAGYTLHAQSPVVVRDLQTESRFRPPALLTDHGVRSGASVTILGPDGPYGVLGIHDPEPRIFATYDVDFLQAVANTLAAAIARHQAAAELRASEAEMRRYVEMIQASYDAIVVWSLQRGIEFWNRGAEELYGYTAEEAIGRVTDELLATQHRQPLAEFIDTLRRVGAWEGELVHHAKDGRAIRVSSRHQLMTGHRGDSVILESSRDITERKEAEDALRQSEERYRYLFETMDEGFCVIEMIFNENGDPVDYRFLEANPAFERFTGLAQAVGRTARELVPNLEAHWFEIYGKVAATGVPFRFEEGSEAMGRWFDVYAFRVGGEESRRVAILFNDITERKQTEIAFEQNNVILSGVLENSKDAIFARDLEGRYLVVNSAGAEQVGMSKEEIVGKTYHELFPQDVADIETDDRPVLEQGLTQSLEYVNEYNGITRYWNTLKMPLRNADGVMIGLISSARDMTERKRAEEELRRTHETLALAQRVSQSGVWDWDIANGHTFWSPEYYDLYGFPPETEPGHEPWIEAIHPDDRARIDMRLREVLDVYGDWNEEFRIIHPERGERWLIGIGLVSYDEEGRPARFTGINLDITERKQSEAQLRYQAYLLENVQDAVISTDLDFRIRTWNQGAEQLYGWSAAEAIGQQVSELLQTDFQGTDREQVRADFATHRRWQGEVLQHTRSGEILHIFNTTVLLRDEGGTPTGAVAVNRDITAQKWAEERLRFLSQASAILATSLDYQITLENVAQTAVPAIADWCVIDLVTEDGSIEGATLAHVDPEKVQWAEELRQRYPIDPDAPAGAPNVIRTGVSEFYPDIPDAMLQAVAKNEEELRLLRSVGYRSVMVVPLETHGRILGAITFVTTDYARHFDAQDLTMAEDLARRAAAAIGNAQLHRAVQQREQQLEASEERLRLATEAGKIGIYDHDLRTNRTVFTDIYRAITGVRQDEALTREDWLARVHPDDRALVAEKLQRAVAYGESYDYQYRIALADGAVRWLGVSSQVTADETGRAVRLTGAIRDITDRKAAEEEIQRLNRDLRRRLDELQTLLDVAPIGIFVAHDPACEVITGNPAGSRMLGMDPVENASKSSSGREQLPFRVMQNGREIAPEELPMQYAVRHDVAVENVEYSVVRHDGSVVNLYEYAIPLHDEEGNVRGCLGIFVDITERKQAEDALRESEERFRSAFEQAAVGMAHLTIDGYYMRVNDRLCDILGYTRGELLQKTFMDITHPDDLETDLTQMARQMAGELAIHSMEKRYLRKDGSVIWANMTASVVYNEEGDAQYGFVVIEDISLRKAADAALRISEERFRAVQQTTPDGFMIFESVRDHAGQIIDFRWLYTNPAGERIIDRSHDYLAGKRLLEEMPGNRESGLFDAYVGVAETGEVWQSEVPYMYDGLHHWFRITAAQTGNGIAVAFDNITGRKRIEEALAQSEVRFRSTFEQAAVGMAHTDHGGRYLQVNERLCEIVGYPRAELMQRRFTDLIHPEERAHSMALNEQLVAGEIASYSVEKRYTRGDGSLIWVNVTASPVRMEAGDVSYRLAVVEDISARKAAEAALQELNATLEERVRERTLELERSNRELNQFAYIASHDLKAPLRAIDHLAGWITEDAGEFLPPASREHLEKLRGRILRMEALLEDLLSYSRAGRIQGEATQVDLGELVDNVISLMTPPGAFEITRAPEMPTITTHRAPLELVLRNLIGNAIKHHHRTSESPPGRVHVTAEARGAFTEFSVADDGPGIAPEYHERIFGMFQTLQPRDEVEGSGIGLAIVKKTVESLRGKVWVESDVGEGAIFHFTWPQSA